MKENKERMGILEEGQNPTFEKRKKVPDCYSIEVRTFSY